MSVCSRCGHYNYEDKEREQFIDSDRFISKKSVLEVVRLWLNEEEFFNGNYYPRRRFANAVQLENFLSEKMK